MGKLARSKLSNRLIGMGDSHLDNFTFFCAATCRIPGATAYGLINDDSETRAREAFKNFLDAFPDYIPLLCVGEVDCNSLPWRLERSVPPELIIQQSVENLFDFIDEFDRKFILPSVILPPIDQYKDLSFRTFVTANQKERTLLVQIYNALLATKAKDYGHYFIDITSQTINSEGLVDKKYIISTEDVHLNASKMYPIVINELDKVIYE
jgi:hypothetical protein